MFVCMFFWIELHEHVSSICMKYSTRNSWVTWYFFGDKSPCESVWRGSKMGCKMDCFFVFWDVYLYVFLNAIAWACSVTSVGAIQVEKVGEHDTFWGTKAIMTIGTVTHGCIFLRFCFDCLHFKWHPTLPRHISPSTTSLCIVRSRDKWKKWWDVTTFGLRKGTRVLCVITPSFDKVFGVLHANSSESTSTIPNLNDLKNTLNISNECPASFFWKKGTKTGWKYVFCIFCHTLVMPFEAPLWLWWGLDMLRGWAKSC